MERRDIGRYKASLPFSCKVIDMPIKRVLDGDCKDFNLKGARFNLDESVTKGSRLNINFKLPHFIQPIIIQAQVVWQIPIGENHGLYDTGVCFTSVRDRDREKIIQFIKENFPGDFFSKWWEGV